VQLAENESSSAVVNVGGTTMGIEDRDGLVEVPNFYDHIQYFFDAPDIDCMRQQRGIDLTNYESVKKNAQGIYFQVKSGRMPPQPDRRWPANRVITFRNWIVTKHLIGKRPFDQALFTEAMARAGVPLRRDVGSLPPEDVTRLAGAFRSLMERGPTDPTSYFALAGIHWFPAPSYCVHHQPQYNPWHRVYVDRFEAGLRTVPGCEDITLPYWDITKRPPEWMFEPPFDSYIFQADASPKYLAGSKTSHSSADEIVGAVSDFEIAKTIRAGLNDYTFEGFTAQIEAAHDNGHGASGPSMSATDIAAFDPLFWFFHCNWERLWWVWQVRYAAGNMDGFRTSLALPDDAEWLDAGFDELDPFGATTGSTIDIAKYRYETASLDMFDAEAGAPKGNMGLERSFRLSVVPEVSLRVKDIARLKVQGSFNVHLLADGEPIAKRFFFQSTTPDGCPNCVDQPLINVDFKIDRDKLFGKELRVEIEEVTPEGKKRLVEPSEIGTPTINIRELLNGQ
jgi:tyrosinase